MTSFCPVILYIKHSMTKTDDELKEEKQKKLKEYAK